MPKAVPINLPRICLQKISRRRSSSPGRRKYVVISARACNIPRAAAAVTAALAAMIAGVARSTGTAAEARVIIARSLAVPN
jgi:hypothetical protein